MAPQLKSSRQQESQLPFLFAGGVASRRSQTRVNSNPPCFRGKTEQNIEEEVPFAAGEAF